MTTGRRSPSRRSPSNRSPSNRSRAQLPLFHGDARAEALQRLRDRVNKLTLEQVECQRFAEDEVLLRFLQHHRWHVDAALIAILAIVERQAARHTRRADVVPAGAVRAQAKSTQSLYRMVTSLLHSLSLPSLGELQMFQTVPKLISVGLFE